MYSVTWPGFAAVVAVPALALASCGQASARAAAPRSGTLENGGVRLAYTIDLPPGRGPFPAVVLAHGSGRVTRDQLRWLSDRWTALGFAVLRFDKRGVGESTGVYSGVGPANSLSLIPELASDVVAATRFLRAQGGIDRRRVGLSGNSQAGWILPYAARELGDAAFVVLFSGPVCSVGLENYYSDFAENTTRPLDEVNALMPGFNGLPGFDNVPTLERLNTPSLWLLGLEDRSIPIPATLANLQKLRAEGHPFEWRTYEGLGHSLSPQVWDDVARWVAPFRHGAPR